MLTRGTSLTFQVTGAGPTGLFNATGSALRGLATAQLIANGLRPLAITVDHDDSFWNPGTSWSYAAMVTVQTTRDHAARADVLAIVANAFESVTGEMPIVTDTSLDPTQPGIDTGPGLFAGVNTTIVLVAIAGIVVLAVLVKVKP